MQVNASVLAALQTSFRVIFNDTLQATKTPLDLIASTVPSGSSSQKYPMGALTAQMREWVGDRHVTNLAAWLASIVNKPFELTLGVDRDDIEDDQTGVYRLSIQQIAAAAGVHPYKLAITALGVDAFVVNGFDGVPFFSDAHTWPGGYETAQSNITTGAISSSAMFAAMAAVKGFKGPNEKPIDVTLNTFVGGRNTQEAAETLFNSATLANGASNPHYGRIAKDRILIEPEFPDDAWTLLDCTRPVKPVIYQERRKAQFVALDRADDPNVFMKREFLYGTDYRGNAAVGPWWLAYGSDGSEPSGSGA